MNNDLIKSIKNLHKEITNSFNEILDNFLKSIEGYEQLNEDGKSICKIFTCINIINKFERNKHETKKNITKQQNQPQNLQN